MQMCKQHTHTHKHTHTHAHTHIYAHIRAHTHKHTHTHTHTHKRTHTHTNTHTHLQPDLYICNAHTYILLHKHTCDHAVRNTQIHPFLLTYHTHLAQRVGMPIVHHVKAAVHINAYWPLFYVLKRSCKQIVSDVPSSVRTQVRRNWREISPDIALYSLLRVFEYRESILASQPLMVPGLYWYCVCAGGRRGRGM